LQKKIRILVVQIGKYGDMILTTPLFKELKRIFPDSELSVLASSRNSDISKNLSFVDFTYEYRKKIVSTIKLIFTLRRKAFDYWIDTKDEYSSTSKILERLCKPKTSLGFNIKEKVFDVNLQNFVIGEHRIDINLSPINYLSESNQYKRILPHIDIPLSDSENISDKLDKIGGKYILFNLSAGINNRDLAIEKWIELVDDIDTDKNILITGIEKDYDNINTILKSAERKNIYFVKTKNIFELAEVIKRADLLVTPDTAAVHLASCFDTPIVCFFNSVKWNQKKFAPLSTKKRIVVSEDENSFDSISSAELLNAVKELLL